MTKKEALDILSNAHDKICNNNCTVCPLYSDHCDKINEVLMLLIKDVGKC